MLAHFVASWGYVGLSWGQCGPILGLCWPILKAMWADLEAYVDPCWAKRAEKWEQQKITVKRRIFWRSAAYLGAMLAHLGAMLAYLEGNVGPSWGYVGPAWGYVGPSWGYLGPSWALCWPILRLCWPILELWWPILRPILAHVDPSYTTCPGKSRKNATSTKHRKTRDFLAVPTLLRQGARPLSPTERRETPSAMPRPGGPWPDYLGRGGGGG